MKPYLAGPINGCTDDECIPWRQRAIAIFPNAIDPMVRDYRGREEEAYREIVEYDKEDIQQCDALFVNYSQPSVGTSMEVSYAWSLRKPVIVWCPPGTTISPWMRYHATHIVDSFDSAVFQLKKLERSTHASGSTTYCGTCGAERIDGVGECYTDCMWYDGDKPRWHRPH